MPILEPHVAHFLIESNMTVKINVALHIAGNDKVMNGKVIKKREDNRDDIVCSFVKNIYISVSITRIRA